MSMTFNLVFYCFKQSIILKVHSFNSSVNKKLASNYIAGICSNCNELNNIISLFNLEAVECEHVLFC